MSRHETPAPAAWVGIDVSQHTLDACLLPCMRKLLMIAYGVLKSRTPFDPSKGGKLAS